MEKKNQVEEVQTMEMKEKTNKKNPEKGVSGRRGSGSGVGEGLGGSVEGGLAFLENFFLVRFMRFF